MSMFKSYIKITDTAKKVMINAAEISKNREIGGILVGAKRNKIFIVTHCIVDYNPPKASCSSLVISTSNIYKELSYLINKYKKIDYVGEWHTHPKGCCNLSKIDYETTISMLNERNYGNFTELIQIICYETNKKRMKLKGYIFRNNLCFNANIKKVPISKVMPILI